LSGDTSSRIAYQAIASSQRMIPLSSIVKSGLAFVTLAALAGCAPDYSPNTYAAGAVQQANKVDPAIVVGYREVSISAAGTVGAVTGGAAGGILGAQVGPNSTASALGAVGGGVVGSLLGTGIEHVTADTIGWEYIVQKPNGDLLSVTQRERQPLPIGQKVLVIAGNQARIIPDTRAIPDPPKEDKKEDKPKEPAKPVVLPPAATSIEPLPAAATAPHSAWDSHAPTPVPENPAPAPEPAATAPAAPAVAPTAPPTPLAPPPAAPAAASEPTPAPSAAPAPADEDTLPEELRQ
jgi:outer membrane lipoprotein SlyB